MNGGRWHGMILGALFLLAFSGGLAGLYSLRREYLTAEGLLYGALITKVAPVT